MTNNQDLLFQELARIIEAGVDRQLNQSIFYSPFRLFYGLFKKRNVHLMNRVREMLLKDIKSNLTRIEGWDQEIFVTNGEFSFEGKLLIKRSYNVGIRVVKRLSVKRAFRAFRDRSLQQNIYNYILNQVSQKAEAILKKKLESA